jgi:hypothetical protein
MIKQGHKYEYFGAQVIAMENAKTGFVRVQLIEPDGAESKLGKPSFANVVNLRPLAMRYFHGAVPG